MNTNIMVPSTISEYTSLKLDAPLLKPFDPLVIEFIDTLSASLRKSPSTKEFPELMALSFWMRKAHIFKIKQEFEEIYKNRLLVAKGTLFHIAPSNVDTIFVYSWFISMLVGNNNIVRVSTKENDQLSYLLQHIIYTLDKKEFQSIKAKTILIQYPHQNQEITKHLSAMCDMRVIWGGDETIRQIRLIPIKPTATELTFADKFSLAILDANECLTQKSISSLIPKFYHDSFVFAQKACSSIRAVVWIGDSLAIQKAQDIFWKELQAYIQTKQPDDIKPANIIDKLVAECSIAINQTSKVSIQDTQTPYINRIKLSDFETNPYQEHCGSGLFYEYEMPSLKHLFSQLGKKYQTISYYGFDTQELSSAINDTQPIGIDRVVPIGKSLDFSHIWDGYDLLKSFTREIEIWS